MALNASKRGFIKKECYMVIDWEMIKGWMITVKGRLCRAAMPHTSSECVSLAPNVEHCFGWRTFLCLEQQCVKCAGVQF